MMTSGPFHQLTPHELHSQLVELEAELLRQPSMVRQGLQQLLEQAQSLGALAQEAFALCLLAGCDFFEGQYESTIRLSNQALIISRQLHLTGLEARCLNALGLAQQRLGELQTALEYLLESLEVAHQAQDEVGQCRALDNLALLYLQVGDDKRALEASRQLRHLAQRGGYTALECDALCLMVEAQFGLGHDEQVLRVAEEALPLIMHYGLHRYECNLRVFLMEALVNLGREREALEVARRSVEVAALSTELESQALAQITLGRAYYHAGALAEARAHLERALELGTGRPPTQMILNTYQTLSQVLETQEEYREALRYARMASEAHSQRLAPAHSSSQRRQVSGLRAEANELLSEHRMPVVSEGNVPARPFVDQRRRDSLTQLMNRNHFFNCAQQVFKETVSPERIAVVLIDLDEFRQVNHQYGYEAGDMVLRQLAQRLAGIVQSEHLLGRIGDDEFIFLLRNIQEERQVVEFTEVLSQALETPVEFEETPIQLRATISYVITPDDGTDFKVIQHDLDMASYHIKQSGGGKALRFSKQMKLN